MPSLRPRCTGSSHASLFTFRQAMVSATVHGFQRRCLAPAVSCTRLPETDSKTAWGLPETNSLGTRCVYIYGYVT